MKQHNYEHIFKEIIHRSRANRWRDQFQEEFGTTVSQEDYQIFSKFSTEYNEFMNSCFHKLKEQLGILNEAITVLIKQNLPAKIETLDGCIISWDFSNYSELKRSVYNSVSGLHEQVKIQVNTSGVYGKQTDSRTARHKRSFRPNFIHSIDASIMRIFL